MSFDGKPPRPTVEQMNQELVRLGWKRWKGHATIWQSPRGEFFRGPYLAWCVATGVGYIYSR
jgi:hypothetical protein